ncbi:DASS family sodium-coupled anion symporter [Halopenitus sp. H-Gu1]|uniref:SLC13 family permease n=1 Tax=Halopenitus sp. H-Gu1 TaxID=3242697 RepID=UPI00359CFE1A
MHARTRALLRMDPTGVRELRADPKRDRDVATDGGEDDSTAHDDDIDRSNGEDGDRASSFDVDDDYTTRRKVGLLFGPIAFVLVLAAPTPADLSMAGQTVGAVAAWMAIWWVCEAVPIPVTALLPLFLFPLTGAVDPTTASAPYANRLVFLFLGGFLLAVAIERWGLHRRIALLTIALVGTSPRRIVLGFMAATAFLSMWVSNTATAMLMTPIGLAVVHQTADLVRQSELDVPTERGEFRFGTTLMLSIAYAASIGGVGTLIGSPPNIIFAGFVASTYGQDISFAQWMAYGVPIAVIGVVVCWFYLTRGVLQHDLDALPDETDVIRDRREALGPMTHPEKLVVVVFGAVAFGWLTRRMLLEPYVPMIDDASIAILGGVLLFVIPVRDDDGEFTFLLDWTTAVTLPWGVILLFGGGLSLAAAVEDSGLGEWIGSQLFVFEGMGLLWIVLGVSLLAVFLTEVTSNTAMTAMLVPILGALAVGLSVHPYALMVAATTVASLAFMLPVATPPNAVVFGSGYLTVPQMAIVGFLLNLIGVLLVVVFVLGWLPIAWGIDVSTSPVWID